MAQRGSEMPCLLRYCLLIMFSENPDRLIVSTRLLSTRRKARGFHPTGAALPFTPRRREEEESGLRGEEKMTAEGLKN